MVFSHKPVMGEEVLSYLLSGLGGTYIDGTLGGGGHTSLILERDKDALVIGLDRDLDALKAAKEALKGYGERVTFAQENFSEMGAALERLGIDEIQGILLDVGVSSYQLDTPERGFSFLRDAPLDMRMDRDQARSAADVVAEFTEAELRRIFKVYGEESLAARFSKAIVKARQVSPVDRTLKLAKIIEEATPHKFRGGRIHPATKVFQALRIEVNDELGALKKALETGLDLLSSGGRFVVITFHSLEDRLVKRAFKSFATGCTCPRRIPKCVCGNTPRARLLTAKVVRATVEEVEQNPRARSAKLRAIEKI